MHGEETGSGENDLLLVGITPACTGKSAFTDFQLTDGSGITPACAGKSDVGAAL